MTTQEKIASAILRYFELCHAGEFCKTSDDPLVFDWLDTSGFDIHSLAKTIEHALT